MIAADTNLIAILPMRFTRREFIATSSAALAAALGLTGALDEARTAARTGLALNSGFTIRRLLATQQSDNPIYLVGLERICEGMRLAGVPEG